MSADFTSIANLINQRTPLDRSQLVAALEEAAHRDPEVTASAARAVTHQQADRAGFLNAAAEQTADRILEEPRHYSSHLVAVILRSVAGTAAAAPRAPRAGRED